MQLSLLTPVRTMSACARTCCIPDAKEPSRIGPCSFPKVNAVVAGAGAVAAGAPREAKSAMQNVGKDVGNAAVHQEKPRVECKMHSKLLAKMFSQLLCTKRNQECTAAICKSMLFWLR